MNQIKLAKPTQSAALFREIESVFSVSIPGTAQSFLQKNSRGVPSVKTFQMQGKAFHLARFLSVSQSDSVNMRSVALLLNDAERKSVRIPFADDGFGNYYCFLYEQSKFVGLVFLDHETDADTVLCDSFEQLLRTMDLTDSAVS